MTYVLLFLGVVVLVMASCGIANVRIGLRGVRTGHEPHCLTCDFDLSGDPTTPKCPECGTAITDDKLICGHLSPSPARVKRGVAQLVPIALCIASFGLPNAKTMYGWLPSPVLVPIAKVSSSPHALNELSSRILAGSLSQADIETISAWVDGGAQEGDPADSPGPVAPLTPPTLDRVDLSLSLAEPYTPQASPDDYRCFLIEWPYEERVWVTGYEVVPGNAAIVHHVIPFLINPDDAEDYRALDAAEPGPGYTCYGGPGGDIETLINTRWLGSWAPGGGARTMPEGYGVRGKPGSLVAVQVHYYSLTTPGPDQTRVNLRIPRRRSAGQSSTARSERAVAALSTILRRTSGGTRIRP